MGKQDDAKEPIDGLNDYFVGRVYRLPINRAPYLTLEIRGINCYERHDVRILFLGKNRGGDWGISPHIPLAAFLNSKACRLEELTPDELSTLQTLEANPSPYTGNAIRKLKESGLIPRTKGPVPDPLAECGCPCFNSDNSSKRPIGEGPNKSNLGIYENP